MESTAKCLHDSSLYGSLLAGDLNAIEPFDTVLPSTYSLSDAYLALGDEGMEKGFTWAYQSPAWVRDKYGCSRMGVLLRRGRGAGLERVGEGIKVGDGLWVTDHHGLHA